jgi:hypothetical protein
VVEQRRQAFQRRSLDDCAPALPGEGTPCLSVPGSPWPDQTREWLVVRTDDAGNTFLVQDALDESAAQAVVTDYTARGHKQTYSALSYSGPEGRKQLLVRLAARI